MNNIKTSDGIASIAGENLSKDNTSVIKKELSGSALSQVERKKQTSVTVASDASSALCDGRTSDETKSLAGSALSQRRGK
ncbi:MAG: hypothetical protein IJ630_01570 [Treponema sp.]|nr:hypothetical protein [Treponema sp.]